MQCLYLFIVIEPSSYFHFQTLLYPIIFFLFLLSINQFCFCILVVFHNEFCHRVCGYTPLFWYIFCNEYDSISPRVFLDEDLKVEFVSFRNSPVCSLFSSCFRCGQSLCAVCGGFYSLSATTVCGGGSCCLNDRMYSVITPRLSFDGVTVSCNVLSGNSSILLFVQVLFYFAICVVVLIFYYFGTRQTKTGCGVPSAETL